jgi:hypothetical protein
MPIYIYHNTETDEYREIVQTMSEVHEYFGTDGDEKCWKRVFTVPQASIDAAVDPFSSKQFVDKTSNKKGTYGDLLDRSNEMSQKRAALAGGVDPVKEKYYENYSKARKGAKHPDMFKKNYESKNVKIDFDSKG